MARGMVANEPIVSQAQSKAFDEGWDRMKHEDDGRRGRFVWDEAQQKLVRADEYVPPPSRCGTTISVDRHYEGARTVDGVDIGSRRKRADYMKATGLAPADDFSPAYYERVRKEAQEQSRKERRETIARALHRIDKP